MCLAISPIKGMETPWTSLGCPEEHKVSGGDVGVNIWLAKVGGKTKAKDEPSEDVSETPGMDPLLSSNPGIHLRTTASTTILQRKNYVKRHVNRNVKQGVLCFSNV